MNNHRDIRRRVARLQDALNRDGYRAGRIVIRNGRIGIQAEHRMAANYDTGARKRIYYLEGTPYQMGYMLGLLAEPETAAMAIHFTEDIVFEFFGGEGVQQSTVLKKALVLLIYRLSRKAYGELPGEIRCEIQGLLKGCRESNPNTKVRLKHLIVLNIGIDVLCSLAYTGRVPFKNAIIKHMKIPVSCNAFSVLGKAAGGGHYFGRDFMFPTAGVFQDAACHIIYHPHTGKTRSHPFVAVTAPGLVGSVAAMNLKGVAAGVDMSPSGNCDPDRVGVNSLLLTRLSIQYGGSAEEAARYIVHANRGVSWNYVVSDGSTDRACCVEAGASSNARDFHLYPPDAYKRFLPDKAFIAAHRSAPFQNGAMVRWNDYKYPAAYLAYNDGLWNKYRKSMEDSIIRYPDAFSPLGHINRHYRERNCPSVFYFAPMRECSSNLIITTNHFIIPEMRMYAMHPWTALIAEDQADDFQWRYDELNSQIHQALKKEGHIGYGTAKRLIDFLAPYGKHPRYYKRNPRSRDGKQIRINGSTSIFDLKRRRVESHFGYYCDDWVKVTLPRYFGSNKTLDIP